MSVTFSKSGRKRSLFHGELWFAKVVLTLKARLFGTEVVDVSLKHGVFTSLEQNQIGIIPKIRKMEIIIGI